MVKRKNCRYESETFKEAEKCYQSTINENLTVKRRIENFQFHFIDHKFLIEIDMKAFLQMFNIKKKQILNLQLLRWVE